MSLYREVILRKDLDVDVLNGKAYMTFKAGSLLCLEEAPHKDGDEGAPGEWLFIAQSMTSPDGGITPHGRLAVSAKQIEQYASSPVHIPLPGDKVVVNQQVAEVAKVDWFTGVTVLASESTEAFAALRFAGIEHFVFNFLSEQPGIWSMAEINRGEKEPLKFSFVWTPMRTQGVIEHLTARQKSPQDDSVHLTSHVVPYHRQSVHDVTLLVKSQKYSYGALDTVQYRVVNGGVELGVIQCEDTDNPKGITTEMLLSIVADRLVHLQGEDHDEEYQAAQDHVGLAIAALRRRAAHVACNLSSGYHLDFPNAIDIGRDHSNTQED